MATHFLSLQRVSVDRTVFQQPTSRPEQARRLKSLPSLAYRVLHTGFGSGYHLGKSGEILLHDRVTFSPEYGGGPNRGKWIDLPP
jgi:hypothetical protein